MLFPWCIALVPTASLPDSMKEADLADHDALPFVNQLMRIPPGCRIYDIYAIPSPDCLNEEVDYSVERIGQIYNTSEFVQSSYDRNIIFKHQRKEEDYEMRPSWLGDLRKIHANIGSSYFEDQISKGRYRDFELKY